MTYRVIREDADNWMIEDVTVDRGRYVGSVNHAVHGTTWADLRRKVESIAAALALPALRVRNDGSMVEPK